jgi:type I restriction enzyme S subunit
MIQTKETKKTKDKLVPALRFKEFDDKWEYLMLEQIGEFYYGKGAPKPTITPEGKTLCVRYGELYSIYGDKIEEVVSKTTVPPQELKLSKGGEVLVPRVGENPLEFANCSFLPFKDVAIGEMISVFNTNQDGLFVTYNINGTAKKKLAKLVEGGNVSNLYYRYVQEVRIGLPSLPEQQKIASFLSAVDEKIQQLTKKKALLEQYKKGVMQQLFSGQLRFKDENGNPYPDWEEKKLGEVCESIKSGKSKSTTNGVIPLYGSTGIIGKCTESSHQGEFILIARVGANAGAINLIDDSFGVSDNTLVVNCKAIFEIAYIYYFLDHFNLNRLIFGSGQPLITGGLLKALKLNLPIVEEQQKIASFLKSIDDKIEAVNNQISQTQTFKKGLLQQMFV